MQRGLCASIACAGSKQVFAVSFTESSLLRSKQLTKQPRQQHPGSAAEPGRLAGGLHGSLAVMSTAEKFTACS